MKDINLSKERWKLVTENESLVNVTLKSMTNKIQPLNEDPDDYREAATWALINAARKFDFNRSTKFSTYAIISIKREIIKKYKKNAQNKKRFKEKDLSQDGSFEPFAYQCGALDSMIKREDIIKLREVFKNLPEKYKKIVKMRFTEGKTFAEIGNEFDVTKEMARVYCKKALGLIENELVGIK